MTKRGVWLLLVAVAVATVSGQPKPTTCFPFPVSVFELDNELKVVNVEVDSPGIVAYYTIVRTGSRNEVEPGFSGYAHFFEHMMFPWHREVPDRGLQRGDQADGRGLERVHHRRLDGVPHRGQLRRTRKRSSTSNPTGFSIFGTRRTDFKTEAGAILGEYQPETFPIRSPSCGRSCSIGPLSSTRTSTRRSVS